MMELKEQGVSLATVKAVCEAGLVEIRKRRVLRDSYRGMAPERVPVDLSKEQESALQEIFSCMDRREYQGFLLYGVTGSGKTQVYIEAAVRAREKGRKVIVLVPEIALTGQLVAAFKAYFRQDIIVMHSRLSLAERNDAVLRVRRGHDFACAEKAARETAARGIPVCGHFILGLPGETRETLLEDVKRINALPLDSVKFHQLQLLKGTPMAAEYAERPEDFVRWTLDEYIDLLCDILERLRPDIAVGRLAASVPPRFLAVPGWGVKAATFSDLLDRRLGERQTWQGKIIP